MIYTIREGRKSIEQLWESRAMGIVGRGLAVFVMLAGLLTVIAASPAIAAGVVGDGSPGSCDEAALDNALIGGGSITFACGPNPVTIPLTFEKELEDNTMIDGGD
ncbi:MAG: hypothetical protein R2849_09680 [Thermomicrobiales bacterium]